MRGLVDLSGGVGRRRNERALLGIAWESGQENAARCICHLSALRCPLQRAALPIAARCICHRTAFRSFCHFHPSPLPPLSPFPPKAQARGCPCGKAGVLPALFASTSAFPLACGIAVPFLSINTAMRKPCSCQLALMVRCLFEEDAPLLGANLHKWQSSRNFAPRLYI